MIKHSFDPGTEHSTLISLLRWRAFHQPSQYAYTFLVDGELEEVSLTYEELDRQAQAIAALLRKRGAIGERVLLCFPPGLDYISAFFGCLYAKAVAVPAYPVDPARPRRTLPRLRAIVESAQAKIALTTSGVLSTIRSLFDQDRSLESVQLLGGDRGLAAIENGWRPLEVTGDTPAFLMYTSGSTGMSKGSTITHGNALHNLAMFPGFKKRPCSKLVSWLPLFHDLGLFFGVLHPLFQGVPAVLMPPASFVQRPFRWLWAISRYEASTTGGPSFAYELCVRKTTPEERAKLDLNSWNMALNGAEPVRPETLERFIQAFEPHGFHREAFYPSYGLAEASATVSGGVEVIPPVVCNFERESLEQGHVVEASANNENTRALVGCGQSLADQETAIVDPDSLTRCSPDRVGEIWVSGPSISAGYWDQPEETERALQACLADTGEGPFLRTGDLGFFRHGELFIAGRLKDLIIIRGVNHYPEDIELTVERSHPAVRPGCVAAFSFDVGVEEQLAVVSEVGTSPQLDLDEAIASIRQKVAEVHGIVIYAIVLIKPGTILKTSSGKIRRRACCAEFFARNLDTVKEWWLDTSGRSLSLGGASIAPKDSPEATDRSLRERAGFLSELASITDFAERRRVLENHIHQLAASVLMMNRSQLSPEQPLNDVGMDSIMVAELKSRIEVSLGVTTIEANLLQSYSVAQLAVQLMSQFQNRGVSEGMVETERLSANEGQMLVDGIQTSRIKNLADKRSDQQAV